MNQEELINESINVLQTARDILRVSEETKAKIDKDLADNNALIDSKNKEAEAIKGRLDRREADLKKWEDNLFVQRDKNTEDAKIIKQRESDVSTREVVVKDQLALSEANKRDAEIMLKDEERISQENVDRSTALDLRAANLQLEEDKLNDRIKSAGMQDTDIERRLSLAKEKEIEIEVKSETLKLAQEQLKIDTGILDKQKELSKKKDSDLTIREENVKIAERGLKL